MGLGWQAVQSSGAATPCVPWRCDWWAPTPMKLVAVFPRRSRGGPSLVVEPWQALQAVRQSPEATLVWQFAQVKAAP